MTERSAADSPLSDGRGACPGMTQTLLAIGTRKGLWLARSDEAARLAGGRGRTSRWRRSTPSRSTPAATRPRLLAGASSAGSGPPVCRSDDLGATWQETPDGGVRFPDDTGASVARVWQLAPGRGRARRRVRRHRARRGLAAPTDRGETFSSCAGSGTTRTGRSGAPGSAARPSTRSCRTPRTRRR